VHCTRLSYTHWAIEQEGCIVLFSQIVEAAGVGVTGQLPLADALDSLEILDWVRTVIPATQQCMHGGERYG
jgi:hypothetical protein